MKLDKSALIKKVKSIKNSGRVDNVEENMSCDLNKPQCSGSQLRMLESVCRGNVNKSIGNGKMSREELFKSLKNLEYLISQYQSVMLDEGVKEWNLGVCNINGTVAVIERTVPLKVVLDEEDGKEKLLSNRVVLKRIRELPQLRSWIENCEAPLVYPALKELSGRSGCKTSHEPIHIQPAKMHEYGDVKVIDIETTTLGYDSYHLLHGIGTIKKDCLHIKQYLSLDIWDRYSLACYTARDLSKNEGRVYFNKKFDETRIAKNQSTMGLRVHSTPCIYDMMYFSKKFFNLPKIPRLQDVELHCLNIERKDGFEVPGALICKYYLEYLKNDSIGSLLPIIYHNQLDIITTAKIFERIVKEW